MKHLRRLAPQRPFWTTKVGQSKLGQMSRLVWESESSPLLGAPSRPVGVAAGELGIMFLGHSSFLLQTGEAADGSGGASVLIDPVFATRLVVLRRQRRPGVEVAHLPPVDAVLLTHAHMDHLNRPTLRRIARSIRRRGGKPPVAIVPRGVADLLQGLGFPEVRTLDWWESTTVGALRITLTPARHWGARLFTDTHRLFGGYVIEDGSGHRLYHSGDTAYFPGFREIGERLAPQIALMPIGAYYPDTYRAVHTSPEEAVQGFLDVGAETMIPMHFGTFRLGREPMGEPPVRLLAEAARLGLTDRVHVLGEGETLVVPARRTP